MSKIVSAINTMISNNHLINNVIQGFSSNEIFFVYNGKYKWSLLKNVQDVYYLHYYPGNQKIEDLATISDKDWSDFAQMVSYNSDELGTREALASLSELHSIVQEKLFGMDEVLDDIIDPIPF